MMVASETTARLNVRVRPAHLGDASSLARLERAAFGDGSWGGDAVADGLTAPGVHGLVARMGGQPGDAPPCGFALWRELDCEAEILTFGVDPAMRRRGVARAILARLIDEAAGIGAVRLFLEVADTNHAARALYEAAGFEAISRRKRYYRNGDDALVMRLRIASDKGR